MLFKPSFGRLCVVFAAVLACCHAAIAGVIHVPMDYPTIQQAVDAALDGNEIHVAAGTYQEAVLIDDKSIAIIGSGPERTIIDADGLNATVITITGSSAAVELIGLQITGGHHADGGAVRVQDASILMSHCIIANNTSTKSGGGVHIINSPAATFEHCQFHGNVAEEYGGAIYGEYAQWITISNCSFDQNSARTGGAVNLHHIHDSEIEQCVFTMNAATESGGAVYLLASDTAILLSEFTGNHVTNNSEEGPFQLNGGALAFLTAWPEIRYCTFNGNSVATSAPRNAVGGAVSGDVDPEYPDREFVIEHCEFVGNSVEAGDFQAGGQAVGGAIYVSGQVTLANSMFVNNYSSFLGGAVSIYGLLDRTNIVTDCHFNGNTAQLDGGAILSASQGLKLLNVAHSTFTDNTSVQGRGGAIHYRSDSTLAIGTIKESTFTGNVAIAGGAVCTQCASISIDKSHFEDNEGLMGAGAILFVADATWCGTSSSTTTTRSSFVANRGLDGGAISSNMSVDISLCIFDSNESTNNGGAVQLFNGYVTSNMFLNNIAGGRGGGVRGGILYSNIFTGNTAREGGGVADASIMQANLVCGNSPDQVAGTYTDEGANVINDVCVDPVEHHVPRDFATIQDAIDAAQLDDTIVIAPGTYEESIHLLSKRLHLYAPAGPEQTILDATNAETRAVTTGATGVGTTIEGLTITGGSNGGVSVNHFGSLTIVNCIIQGNDVEGSAAAVLAFGEWFEIVDSVIQNNSANRGVGGVFSGATHNRFESTTFRNNSTEVMGGAVGLAGQYGEFIQCVFENNSAGTQGGALRIANFSGVLFDTCEFRNNSAPVGGAVWVADTTELTIANSLFCGNEVDDIDGDYTDAGDNDFASTCPDECSGDLNGDGAVGIPDLLLLLSAWGTCTHGPGCTGDLTGDGTIGVADMLALLNQWGVCS